MTAPDPPGTGAAFAPWGRAGYAVGWELVSRYQASHGGASAASLWNTQAEDFRPR